ncbi:hypothetical protein BGZ46_009695 [Entomortierella lignicola]|nr:hypothetical protein BGZ46_009695 [Entomortierella lignicola]
MYRSTSYGTELSSLTSSAMSSQYSPNSCNPFISLNITSTLQHCLEKSPPNLDQIYLGGDAKNILDLNDDEVASSLSGSNKGWKEIEVKRTAHFGQASVALHLTVDYIWEQASTLRI